MEDCYEVLVKNTIYYKKISKAFPLDPVRKSLGLSNLKKPNNEPQAINLYENNENLPLPITGIILRPREKPKKVQHRRNKKPQVQKERAQKPVYDFIND